MLQAEHQAQKYGLPGFASQKAGDHTKVFYAIVRVDQSASIGAITGLGTANEHPVEALLREFMDLRDELAYRRLRGETLGPREGSMLDALNLIAMAALPRAEELPSGVQEAIREAFLLDRVRNGTR